MSKIKLSFDAVKPFVDKAGTLAKQGFQSLSKLVQNRDFQKRSCSGSDSVWRVSVLFNS